MRALKFIASNSLYLIWFVLYFLIAGLMLGGTRDSFIWVSIIYGVSITIALSPIGEVILQISENCREPSTEQEREYLLPLFEEVYENAIEVNPKLNKGIKLYIMDAMYVNAFAMGRKTVAVTKGAIETFTADELKGVLAHELGHITHGHTKALLLSVIGNFFFTVLVWIFRAILFVVQVVSDIVADLNYIGAIFSIFTLIARVLVDVSVFVFINLGQTILASNSRFNEFQADKFALDIGHGRELISGLYLLQKISINRKMSWSEQSKASHPHIAHRIAYLERLESQLN